MTPNLILSFPNHMAMYSPTLSGGTWVASAPLSNLLAPQITKVARSNSASTGDTIIRIDFGFARTMQCFSLINHNIQGTGQWRIKLGTTSGASDVYLGSWENIALFNQYHEPLFWSDEDLGFAYDSVTVLASSYSARYLTIELSDSGNPDDYLQLGRIFAGPLWQPNINAAYGLQDFVKDMSTSTRAESGTLWQTERRRTRGVKFALEWLSFTEAEWFHELMMSAGTVKEVLYIPKPLDLAYSQRYGFTGKLSELSAIEYPYYNSKSTGVSVESLT